MYRTTLAQFIYDEPDGQKIFTLEFNPDMRIIKGSRWLTVSLERKLSGSAHVFNRLILLRGITKSSPGSRCPLELNRLLL